MPLRYAHLDPGHLAEYADRTLLGEDSRRKSVIPAEGGLDEVLQVVDFNGREGLEPSTPAL
jgi:hypothetical protein